jgi:ABC-type sugar transport system ATPase subunit
MLDEARETDFDIAIAGRSITKRFGHVQALAGADVEVKRGEVVALFGDNGAGKSTLLKTLMGINSPDSGEVVVRDQPVRLSGIRDAQAVGVEAVHQDLAIAPDLSVVDNMFLGHPIYRSRLLGAFGIIDRKEMAERADAALRELHIKLPSLRIPIGELSGGQRQAVAVARAVMWGSTAILMDEPTAALGARQSELVCDLMRTVAARGLGVLVVSHDLPRVMKVADRVTILWRGRTAITADPRTLTVPEVVATMVGYGQEAAA